MIFHTQLNCFVPLNVVYLFLWRKVRRASFHFIILGALMFRGESVLLLHFFKKYESGDSNTKSYVRKLVGKWSLTLAYTLLSSFLLFLMSITLLMLAIRNTSNFFFSTLVFWNNFKFTEKLWDQYKDLPQTFHPNPLIVENFQLLYHSFSKYTFMYICICIFFSYLSKHDVPITTEVQSVIP